LLELSSILSIYRKTRFNLIEKKTKKISLPKGNYKFALIESYTIPNYDAYIKIVDDLLTAGYFIIHTIPKLPVKPIIDKNLIYVIAPSKKMGITTFTKNTYSKFSFVYGLDESGKLEAIRVSKTYAVELNNNTKILPKGKLFNCFSEESAELNILFDTNYDASCRGLGDILMTTAIIKQIKKEYPNSYLTYSTRPEGKAILTNNPYVDNLKIDSYSQIELEKDLDKYDKHFFLGKMTEDYLDKRNRQPRIDSMAEMFDIKLDSKLPELYITSDELDSMNKYINNNKFNIIICIEGVEKYRNWRLDYLKELVSMLDSKKYNLILVGNKKVDIAGVVNLTGETTIRQLFSIIAQSDLVVTMDNFVSHIAAAFNIKEIIMYTTIPAEWRSLYYENATAIQSPVDCSPCWNCYKDKNKRCTGDGKCVDALTPKVLFNYIKKSCLKKSTNLQDFFSKPIKEKLQSKNTLLKNNSKIICISLWRRLGDCLFAIPTIKQIRKKYQDHRIIWLTHYKYYDIVKNLPYIDDYVLFQGKMKDGWDAYLLNPESQITKFVNQLNPEKFYDLHISPDYSSDLTKKTHSIVEYVGYELAKVSELDTKLEYFPDVHIDAIVKKDFKEFGKGYKGIITYNASCFSIAHEKLFSKDDLNKILGLFEKEGYRVINLGHILDEVDSIRTNYQHCSFDYLYYGVKYSDLFIGFDSGVRNIALAVPNSKVISLDNKESIKNKSLVDLVSDSFNHVGVNIEKEQPYNIYLKGKSLLENKEVSITEYSDILKYQFIRRKEK
jgi:ADP-heptose:LPS heptosyltransferase